MHRAYQLTCTALLATALAGCPVTDDYYLLPAATQGGSSAESGTGGSGGGTEAGSAAQAGSSASGGAGGADATRGSGGESDAGEAGEPSLAGGAGGVGPEPCLATTERCNGHDDDCDDLVDEFACLTDCSGFALASDPDHGYMFCTGARMLNWDNAKQACEDQDMRLAWLETAEENEAIALKLNDLSSDAEVLFGATDQGNEGDWLWFGGEQFWRGNAWQGYAVEGRFNAWAYQTPNNANNNEDCALLGTAGAVWVDRTCGATYPFLCEQPN